MFGLQYPLERLHALKFIVRLDNYEEFNSDPLKQLTISVKQASETALF